MSEIGSRISSLTLISSTASRSAATDKRELEDPGASGKADGGGAPVRMRYVVTSFQGDAYVYIPPMSAAQYANAPCGVLCCAALDCGDMSVWFHGASRALGAETGRSIG
jgi:hypothetical protein